MSDNNGLEFASLLGVSRAIATREISAREATTHLLRYIDRVEPEIGAFALLCHDEALAAADQADREIARDFHRGPLHGVPVAIKDLLFTQDQVTASGMPLYADWRSREDATTVERLKHAGAVIVGKAQMTEGAMLAHHPDIKAPRNPWDHRRSSGFSSSGSGASVAAGMAYAALGSDTGGSIRIPSCVNGITGIKPTWGRVSRHGVFPLVEYLDTIGPLARTAQDAAAVLRAIAGPDPRDPTASPIPVPNYLATIEDGISGVVIGIDPGDLESCCDAQVLAVVNAAAETFSELGAQIRTVSMPSFDRGGIYPLFVAGAADAHRATYPQHAERYGPGLRGILDQAAATPIRDVAAAINHANALRGRLASLFTGIDLLLVPVLTRPTPDVGEVEAAIGGNPAAIGDLLRFTTPFNVSGQPAITCRGGSDSDGLPIGFQLVARPFEEELLFRAGHAYQRATDWHTHHPAGIAKGK